jgi:hypothetical protein
MLSNTDGYNVCKMLGSDIEKYFIVITSDNNMIFRRKPITGMNPKASFGSQFSAIRVVSYPPLCGIVQLTNSDALFFQNWSFTKNKI